MVEHNKRAVKIEPGSALRVTVGNPFSRTAACIYIIDEIIHFADFINKKTG